MAEAIIYYEDSKFAAPCTSQDVHSQLQKTKFVPESKWIVQNSRIELNFPFLLKCPNQCKRSAMVFYMSMATCCQTVDSFRIIFSEEITFKNDTAISIHGGILNTLVCLVPVVHICNLELMRPRKEIKTLRLI